MEDTDRLKSRLRCQLFHLVPCHDIQCLGCVFSAIADVHECPPRHGSIVVVVEDEAPVLRQERSQDAHDVFPEGGFGVDEKPKSRDQPEMLSCQYILPREVCQNKASACQFPAGLIEHGCRDIDADAAGHARFEKMRDPSCSAREVEKVNLLPPESCVKVLAQDLLFQPPEDAVVRVGEVVRVVSRPLRGVRMRKAVIR